VIRHLTLELPEGVTARLGASAPTDLAGALQRALDAEVARLGIPGKVALDLRDAPLITDPWFFVDGASLRYPRSLLVTAWTSVIPAEHHAAVGTTAGHEVSDTWLLDATADLNGSAIERFLVSLGLAVVRRRPSRLLAALAVSEEHRKMLSELLDLGVTLPRAETALSDTEAATSDDLPDHEVIELAYARSRKASVDISAHPDALEALADEWRADLHAEEQLIFEELGVRIPPVRLTQRGDFESDEFEITVLGSPARHVVSEAASGDFSEQVLSALVSELRDRRGWLLSLAEVDRSLSTLEFAFPAIARALAAIVPTADLMPVLRLLLDEGISVRDLRMIADRLLEYEGVGMDARPEAYAEFIRRGLQDLFAHRHAPDGHLEAITVEGELEDALAGFGFVGGAQQEQILDDLRVALAAAASDSVVLLTTGPARRVLREAVAPEFPDIPVLAREELPLGVDISRVGSIGGRVAVPAQQP